MKASETPEQAMSITYRDIEDLVNHDEFLGFGYLGHSGRTHDSDVALAEVANEQGWTLEQIFVWANSKDGRWFLDTWAGRTRDEPKMKVSLANNVAAYLPGLLDYEARR